MILLGLLKFSMLYEYPLEFGYSHYIQIEILCHMTSPDLPGCLLHQCVNRVLQTNPVLAWIKSMYPIRLWIYQGLLFSLRTIWDTACFSAWKYANYSKDWTEIYNRCQALLIATVWCTNLCLSPANKVLNGLGEENSFKTSVPLEKKNNSFELNPSKIVTGKKKT